MRYIWVSAVTLLMATSVCLSAEAEGVIQVQRSDEGVPGRSLAENGDCEQVRGSRLVGFGAYGSGYEVRPGEGRSESTAALCSSLSTDSRYGLALTFNLNQKDPLPIRFSAWSRAEDVSSSPDNNYSLYIDYWYADGTPVWGTNAPFSTGTHDWEYKTVSVDPNRPIARISCYALFRGHAGKVWFDDFSAVELSPKDNGALLDGLPVFWSALPGTEGSDVKKAGNGLSVEMSRATSAINAVWLDGRRLPLGDCPSGFLVRDVAGDSDYFHFSEGMCSELNLRLVTNVSERESHLRLEVSLETLDERDRCISLLFALPVDATDWLWWDHVRGHRDISGSREYTNTTRIGVGSNGRLSLYPVGCISSGDAALGLAVDVGDLAQYRIGYNAGTKQLFIVYDLALIPESKTSPNGARISFVVFRIDPSWGFRSALGKLYSIFPDYFLCRSTAQGIWMPFTDVSSVEGWEDFGFRYHEGINNVRFDDQAGVLSFRYSEPSTWWLPIDPEIPRTDENVLKLVQEYAADPKSRYYRRAKALLSSGTVDRSGHFQYRVENQPWTNGVVFSLNPCPYLPGEITSAKQMWNPDTRERLYGERAVGDQDGEYLDSLEGYVTADLNFRRDHFIYARTALTFTEDTREPVLHKAFQVYELTRYLGEEMHRMGKLLFANAVPHRFSFLCPWIDIMGTETNWLSGGKFVPDSDEVMNFRRSMCAKKPYLFLMNTGFDSFPSTMVEKYFQRSLFYGMFPSMFSHNAAEDRYWETPQWYNRDRHLFKQYQPLIETVAEAGWEPMTMVRSSEPDVWLERFGRKEMGEIYITMLNTSTTPLELVLMGEGTLSEVWQWTDPLTQETGAWRGGMRIALVPDQVRVLRLHPSSGVGSPER